MRWFRRWTSARDVADELLRGLGDGSLQLGAERWARLEARLPVAAEVRRELAALQQDGYERAGRIRRSIARDYARGAIAALVALALIGGGGWWNDGLGSGLVCALGGAIGTGAVLTCARAARDHRKVSAHARWVQAIQDFLDWPASETEAALRRAAELAQATMESPPEPDPHVGSVRSVLARLSSVEPAPN